MIMKGFLITGVVVVTLQFTAGCGNIGSSDTREEQRISGQHDGFGGTIETDAAGRVT